ncbi:hypothetical protein NW762_000078 [Fusarium torreyae]|uniref:Uncharacterized protein n=1 Tax=Fusarium torreyae TaxID=1237075 RepID=A0A9W8SH76_9HYPO|nr:hypothetical protein NW762_000078 [Fusarium torreyae]
MPIQLKVRCWQASISVLRAVPLPTLLDKILISNLTTANQQATGLLMIWSPIELSAGALKLSTGPMLTERTPSTSELGDADIRRMSLYIDWAKVIRVPNRKTMDKSGPMPEAVQIIIRLVNDHLPTKGDDTIGAGPYVAFLKDTRNGHTDLTYDNVDMSGIIRPAKPVPVTTIFHNGAHRTVTHMVGAVYEVTMLDEQCLTFRDTTSQAVNIEDVLGKCMSSPDDLVKHGIVADSSSPHQYFCVPIIEGLTSPETTKKDTRSRPTTAISYHPNLGSDSVMKHR